MSVEAESSGQVKAIVSENVYGQSYVGIVYAKDWFPNRPYYIGENNYVVCRWSDFHDGLNSHIEGKTTIAICKDDQDARILYNKHRTIHGL